MPLLSKLINPDVGKRLFKLANSSVLTEQGQRTAISDHVRGIAE